MELVTGRNMNILLPSSGHNKNQQPIIIMIGKYH